MDDRHRCKATSKTTGQQCRKARMRGATVCRSHGGAASQVKAAASRRAQEAAAAKAVATYGLPREVDPHDALLEEVHRTAGHVAWLGGIVAEIDVGDLVWGKTEEAEKRATEFAGTDTTYGAKPNVWLELYHRERQHLTNVCKACITAGIDERRVRIAEQQGELIAQVIRGVLTDLGVADHPDAPAAVRKHLTAVAG